MQVEVSKYTEGINEKALRPNGLPKSLIRYDGKHLYPALLMDMTVTASIIIFSCVSSSEREGFRLHHRGCPNC